MRRGIFSAPLLCQKWPPTIRRSRRSMERGEILVAQTKDSTYDKPDFEVITVRRDVVLYAGHKKKIPIKSQEYNGRRFKFHKGNFRPYRRYLYLKYVYSRLSPDDRFGSMGELQQQHQIACPQGLIYHIFETTGASRPVRMGPSSRDVIASTRCQAHVQNDESRPLSSASYSPSGVSVLELTRSQYVRSHWC